MPASLAKMETHGNPWEIAAVCPTLGCPINPSIGVFDVILTMLTLRSGTYTLRSAMTYLQKIESELSEARLLSPVIVSSRQCKGLAKEVHDLLPQADLGSVGGPSLMGRDVVLVHAGEMGWDALELVCQQSPGRLFVVAPELPRAEALRLEWVADGVMVGEETFQYEVHELGLSA